MVKIRGRSGPTSPVFHGFLTRPELAYERDCREEPMSDAIVLVLAILAASGALLFAVAFSLAQVGPPAEQTRRILPTRVLCPATGSLARVEIGFEVESGRLGLARCEHFPSGVFDCERECFPTLMLSPFSLAAEARA